MNEIHQVKASTFADPGDVAAYRKCKARGGSDQECFRVGDNAVGEWGDDTSQGSGPAVALPPEDWKPFGASARNKRVLLTNPANGKTVIARLRDSMPSVAHITNGCRIDCNPDTCAALGITPPDTFQATWQWYDEPEIAGDPGPDPNGLIEA